MQDTRVVVIAKAILNAPEQGDWPDDDHLLGVGEFVLRHLERSGWRVIPAEHSDGEVSP